MKNFYNKVIATFEKAVTKELFLNQNISPVSYIDLYVGQDQFEENFELFAQPAILLDWDIDHSQKPSLVTLTVYCCYEQLRDTSNISEHRDKALRFIDYFTAIDNIFSTIQTENTGRLEMISEGFHKMDSIVDIYILTYEFSYTGRKKSPQGNYQGGEYDTLSLKPNLVQKFDFG